MRSDDDLDALIEHITVDFSDLVRFGSRFG